MAGKKFKYSVSVAVLSTMILATPTFASPENSKVTQAQINQTQGQINDFETKIQQLDNQISDGMVKSQKLNEDIKAQQAKIEAAKAEIEKAKKDLDAHKKIYSERLRSYQSQGQQPLITYAEILLSSDNISEFLTRSTAISQFLQSDSDLLNGLVKKQQVLDNAKEQLNNELDKLKSVQDELAAEQKKIEEDKQTVQKELADSKNNLQLQQSQLAQQQAEEQAQQKALQQAADLARQQAAAQQNAQQTSSGSSSSTPNASADSANLSNPDKASKVIAYAEQFLGVPYVWGGSSPSGFDCSGLMQYVFHSVGVSLPRIASAQQNAGARISTSAVQPGDLVFQGDPAYHVGMYIGGGKWIQAPETGDVVKISIYNPSKFSSAARVLR
ncbi:MAG: NlpC/P60 family protein [Bacillota bacterium]|nr:NlpC/P60 family protein [Bacillota bacterium]MDP4154575.1 NlpC/P60 family protein [Bacillota bacterium]